MAQIIGKRIVIVGTTGSGKTTLAGQISTAINAPHIELDRLYWEPGWVETQDEQFMQKVRNALSDAGDSWVIDGNYRCTRPIIWTVADTLIWLDYSLYINYWRLFWRSLRRSITREELWNGNRERFRTQFFSRDSLFVWAYGSHQRRRPEFEAAFANGEYPHLSVIRFHRPNHTNQWLKRLQAEANETSDTRTTANPSSANKTIPPTRNGAVEPRT